jgi:hypothetical protein
VREQEDFVTVNRTLPVMNKGRHRENQYLSNPWHKMGPSERKAWRWTKMAVERQHQL